MGASVSYPEQLFKCRFISGHSPQLGDHVPGGMGMYQESMKWLRKQCEAESKAAIMKRVDAAKATFYNAIAGRQDPSAANFMAWLETLGAKIVFPGDQKDTTKDVCFVDAQLVRLDGTCAPIPPERYKAIPLAKGQVAAGPGLIPEDSVRGWVLALKDHSSIKYRTNLVAVEIGKGQLSMVPTLHPLDIVLIDRDDFNPDQDGSIFLVRDPDDNVAVKRVYVQRKNGGTLLQFVSDNPEKRDYPPAVFSLEEDYAGELRRALVGRVVWAWSDMTRK
jgi:hypothetical protein